MTDPQVSEEEVRRALHEAADAVDVADALGVILARIKAGAAWCPMCDGEGRPGGCLLCTREA